MINYEKIGQRIAEQRKYIRRLSQERLAEELGMYQADISNLEKAKKGSGITDLSKLDFIADYFEISLATVYKGNIIKNLIMDCQSYTKYRPNETTGGIFVSWRRKEELPTGA